jgi:hypothetical protein
MNTPTMYQPRQLQDWSSSVQQPDGSYYPARPMGFQGLCLGKRLSYAWKAFTGQVDVLDWRKP